MDVFTKSHPLVRFAILSPNSSWSLALHLEFDGGCYIIYCTICTLSHISYWCVYLYYNSIYIDLSCTILCVIKYVILFSTLVKGCRARPPTSLQSDGGGLHPFVKEVGCYHPPPYIGVVL